MRKRLGRGPQIPRAVLVQCRGIFVDAIVDKFRIVVVFHVFPFDEAFHGVVRLVFTVDHLNQPHVHKFNLFRRVPVVEPCRPFRTFLLQHDVVLVHLAIVGVGFRAMFAVIMFRHVWTGFVPILVGRRRGQQERRVVFFHAKTFAHGTFGEGIRVDFHQQSTV